jgi:hypothetical protein
MVGTVGTIFSVRFITGYEAMARLTDLTDSAHAQKKPFSSDFCTIINYALAFVS